jgi:hypothetical protein
VRPVAEAGEEKQELKLPGFLKKLAESKSGLRNDIRDAVLNIVFKVAEKSGVYLNPYYILNHMLAARIREELEEFVATILLDNGLIIEAMVTPYNSWIAVDSTIKCDCTNICEERDR